MKKINLSNIQEGVRKLGAVKQLFEHMESAYISGISDLLYGLLSSFNGPTALYGCVNSGSGSTYNISAGSIFHNGEIYAIAAFSGTATGGNVPVLGLNTANTQLAYTDFTNQNTLEDRTYVWSFAAPGSGLADFSGVSALKTRINSNLLDVPGQVTAAINALVASAPGALDTLDELAAALGDDANFASTVTTALAGKVAKAGDTMSGDLNMNSHKLTNVTNGSAAGDAVNKGQLDLKVAKTGDTMSGSLDMTGNKVTNLANASASGEAATYAQIADKVVSSTIIDIGTDDFNTLTSPIDTAFYYSSVVGPSNGWGVNFDKYYRFSVSLAFGVISQVGIGLNVAKIYTRYSTNGGSSWSSWVAVV